MMRIHRGACPNPRALTKDYKHPENKEALKRASSDKCMFCESKVSVVYFGDVEHFRPRKHFDHLTFDWENLGFVCARCNNAKSDKWSEALPFIDPYTEEPTEHIAAVGFYVRQRRGSERGELTIREIELNRPELLARRMDRLDAIGNLVDKMVRTVDPALRALIREDLTRETASDKEFHLCATAYLQSLLGGAAA